MTQEEEWAPVEDLVQASDLRRGSAFLYSFIHFAHIFRGPAAYQPMGAEHTVMTETPSPAPGD